MKYCPFCGSGLQETMVFCPKCGKRFLDAFENPEAAESVKLQSNDDVALPSTQEKVGVQVLDDMAEAAAASKSELEQPIKKNAKKGPWVLVLLILIFGVAGFFWMKGSDDTVSITDAANSVLYLEVCDDTDEVIATASGFVIKDGTTLVTNYHVIDGAHHIIAYTPDGENSVEVHTVLAYDEDADLAVLECEDNIGVPPLLLGDSDAVKQGDAVFAVGYPLGLANTLSDGVISSRYLDENNIDILQITAAISSGSSGGALFNKTGQVVGVICASYIDGQNLNIAIPSNTVSDLLVSDCVGYSLDERYVPPLYTDDAIEVSVEDLYYTPALYDGKNIVLTAWIAYSALRTPTSAESFYDMFLVEDTQCFLGDDKLSTKVNADEFQSLFMHRYYSEYIEKNSVPYIGACLYESNTNEGSLADLSFEREKLITVLGEFTYNPMYDEGGYITDPHPFHLKIYDYRLN